MIRITRSLLPKLRRGPHAVPTALARIAPSVLTAAMTLTVTVFADASLRLHFLQKAADYTPAKNAVTFKAAETFFENIQTSAMPLVIPASLIAIAVGSVGIMYGRDWGSSWLSGALAGVVMVFLSPQILA
jgi:hypothetical protein